MCLDSSSTLLPGTPCLASASLVQPRDGRCMEERVQGWGQLPTLPWEHRHGTALGPGKGKDNLGGGGDTQPVLESHQMQGSRRDLGRGWTWSRGCPDPLTGEAEAGLVEVPHAPMSRGGPCGGIGQGRPRLFFPSMHNHGHVPQVRGAIHTPQL